MSDLLVAAREVLQWLQEADVPACLIGGLAVQRWGEPRLTQDVDITVLAGEREDALLEACSARFRPRVAAAVEFARTRRVLLVSASNGVAVDLALGSISFEREVIDRGSDYDYAPEMRLRTCSAEHLIVYKAVAARPRDVADLEGIVVRQFDRLDVPLIRQWLVAFRPAVEHDAVEPFERAWAKAQGLRQGR